jgi:hypothetical protein
VGHKENLLSEQTRCRVSPVPAHRVRHGLLHVGIVGSSNAVPALTLLAVCACTECGRSR